MNCVICLKASKSNLAKVNCCNHRFCDECIDGLINHSQNCPRCDSFIRLLIYSDGDFCNLEDDEEEEEEEDEFPSDEEECNNRKRSRS